MQILKNADFNWHVDQPDVPQKSAQQMKQFFDAPTRVLMEKINEIIGEGGEIPSLTELQELLGEKADAKEYLLMIQGLQSDHNAQNELIKALDDRLTAQEEISVNQGHDIGTMQSTVESNAIFIDQQEVINERQFDINGSVAEELERLSDALAGGAGSAGSSAEWQTLHTQNGKAVYYDDSSPLEVTGFSCTQLRGMFNVKGGWDAVADDMRDAFITINDTLNLNISSFCGEMTYDAPDVVFDISVVSFGGADYLEINLKRTPSESDLDGALYNNTLPTPSKYYYFTTIDADKITSFKITSSYTYDEFDFYHNHTAKLELEGR